MECTTLFARMFHVFICSLLRFCLYEAALNLTKGTKIGLKIGLFEKLGDQWCSSYQAGGSKNRGFEKLGFNCMRFSSSFVAISGKKPVPEKKGRRFKANG